MQKKLTELKGVGEKTAALFAKKGICTVDDLLHMYPYDYDYFSIPVTVDDAQRMSQGQTGTVKREPVSIKLHLIGNGTMSFGGGYRITSFRAADLTGQIRLVWFNMPYLTRALHAGEIRVFRGYLKKYKNGNLELTQAGIYTPEEYDALMGTFQPRYSLTQGLKNSQVIRVMQKALQAEAAAFSQGGHAAGASDISHRDYLTPAEQERLELIGRREALQKIHFPSSLQEMVQARSRLVFDEFTSFLAAVRRQNNTNGNGKIPDPAPMKKTPAVQQWISRLPYKLTQGQEKAWEEIEEDLTGPYVMNRLLQGDVGSGKTILAFLTLLLCVENGRQGAMMAPTEVLAEQHYDGIVKMTSDYGLPFCPVLLTGSMSAAKKRKAYADIASGEANVIIGTHALIQDKVRYRNLGVVITDEQHRFGVRQRETLADKGEEGDFAGTQQPVHVLVMSATPIPRTLAMILYGDLQISQLRGLPAERLPIKNLAASSQDRGKIYKFILGQIREGHQVYVICPAVEESELEGLENVKDYTEKIRQVLPEDIRIASLNGRMKPAEKTAVMSDFAAHRTDILVSTTVIEVGINVPNATVMLVENAERFGLSQLHQLRGRVGRGSAQSYCVFLYSEDLAEKPKRLQILEKSNDGFYIAEEDLGLRGPGDMFGTRQSGEMGFTLADIYEDAGILTKASAYVDEKLAEDPDFDFGGHRSFDARTI